MKRGLSMVLALAFVSAVGLATAQAGGPGCSGHKDAKTASASCAAKSACSEGFPTLAMMVGDKSFECPMAAEKAAKDAHGKVVYVVAGERFDGRDKATQALADAAESYVNRFTSIACVADGKVMYCSDKDCSSSCSAAAKGSKAKADGMSCCMAKGKASMTKAQIEACCKNAKSVKFMVAGRTFEKREEAVKTREAVLAAVKGVSMKYIVDGKEVDCSSKVCPMAKAAGKVQYVVKGEKTPCEYTARVSLAKAQYEAARTTTEKKLVQM